MNSAPADPRDSTRQQYEYILHQSQAYHAAGDITRAATLYRTILAEFPHLSRIAYNLGNILKDQERYDEAETFFRQALRAEPGLTEAALNLAFVLQEQGRIEEALAACTEIIRHRPELPDPRFNRACLQLLKGDLLPGWEEYDLRFATQQPVPARHASLPLWDGTLHPGLRLLIHTEQGYGDAVQMSRYLPHLAQAGLRVWLETTPPLATLLARLPGLEGCILRGSSLPDVDAQAPIMSLPRLMKTTLDTIPPPPLLKLDEEVVRRMASLLPASGTLRVGLAWAGRLDLPVNRKRSCPAGLIAGLLDLPVITFVSLHTETPDQFRLTDPHLLDLSSELHDFHATAALITNLDMVITIDTAVAHLAGTLGKPTWLLLPYVPDWRWLLERTDSPWYPTMRLFRQSEGGNWISVLATVRSELTAILCPRAYVYRPGIDFTEPDILGIKTVPLLDGSPSNKAGQFAQVETPEEADLLIFPYYLENFTEHRTISGMFDFIRCLPAFAERECDHVFFSDHDSPARHHTSSIWFRASLSRESRDLSAFPLAYLTEDPLPFLHFDPNRLRYHSSFAGYLGPRMQRAPLIRAVQSETRLVCGLDIAESFHGHQTEAVRLERRRRYLELCSQSLTVLCPEGDGTNSIRFFEVLSLGRLPVLVSDCPLPFEDRIDYDRFVIRISPSDTSRAGTILHNWLVTVDSEELLQRCRTARLVWEEWFSPKAMPRAVTRQLLRHMLHRRHHKDDYPTHHFETSGNDPLQTAIPLLETGSSEAEPFLRQALNREPRNPLLYLMLGLFLKCQNRRSEAETAFREAILYNNRCFDAYMELAVLYTEQGRDMEAVERFYEASLIQPNHPEPYRMAITPLLRMGRTDEAQYCRECLKNLEKDDLKAPIFNMSGTAP